jgi:hypothetical protein
VAVLRGHVSSVKSLCLVAASDAPLGGTVYLVSAGGRAQLKIWSLTRTSSGAEEEELMAKELDSFMLLGSDKAVRRPWKATASGMRPDPETRFLCIAAVKEFPGGQLRIFVGCSDAALRIFTYNCGAKLVLVSELAWQEHCILQVRHFTLLHEEEEVGCILVTTTGGRMYGLLLLSMSEHDEQGGQPRVGGSLQAHQSGINAVDVRTVAGEQSGLVLSGGDDNSLLLTRVSLTAQRMLQFVPLWRHSAAHAAQITGVKLLGKDEFV